MIKGKSVSLFLWALALVLVSACSKDPARETKKWAKLQQDAAEYTTTWPNLKPVVDVRLAEGKKAMDATKSISDKEKQGEAMAKAIEIPGKLVGRLGEVKYKSQAVEDSIKKLNRMKLTKSQSKLRKSVVGDARQKLQDVQRRMAELKPATEEQAMEALSKTIGILISTKGSVDRSIKSFKNKS